jgi:succinoglycan biosynthesis transport protein ExoP
MLAQGNQSMKSITGSVPDSLVPIQARIAALPASGMPGTHAPAFSAALDAAGLFNAFRRRWRLSLGLGVIGAIVVGALAWCFLPPPKHTAESLLLVETEQPRLIAETKEYRSDPITDRRTQVALIKSLVVSKVVAQREVADLPIVKKQRDPTEWLEREVNAEFTGTILRLALTSDNPAEASTIVKAVTHTYLDEVANKEKLQRIVRNQILEGHYNKLENQLESKRKQLRTLSATIGSKHPQALSMQQRLAINRQGMAEEELLRTQAELKRAMVELKVLQSRRQKDPEIDPQAHAPGPTAIEVSKAIQNDPVVQEYLQTEQQLRATIENQGRVARKKSSDPAIARAKGDLARVQKQREAYVKQRRAALEVPLAESSEVRNRAESGLASLQEQIEVMAGLEQELRDEVGKFTDDTRKLDSQAIEVESINDEIKSAEEMAKLIGRELEVLKIELNAPDRVRLLKDARGPNTSDSSRQIKLAGMAAGGTFGALILLISFWEFRSQRIGSLDQVAHGLGIKVVGTVPVTRGRTTSVTRGSTTGEVPKLMGEREQLWQHQLVESVDATRIMLTHTARAESHQVVLVTSAVGGEGKTTLASHLATSLARSGQRTLLVDGDLRRPMVHRLYDQPAGPGFCELLRGDLGVNDVIRPTALNNLWVITAGAYDEHALSVLAQPRSRNVFDQLREQFDFIVVDSAPVLPVADTLLLGQHVDAALFSILRDVSQLPRIHAAHGRMAALGVPILGAVVSGTNADTHYKY